jgi:hypothetical protein
MRTPPRTGRDQQADHGEDHDAERGDLPGVENAEDAAFRVPAEGAEQDRRREDGQSDAGDHAAGVIRPVGVGACADEHYRRGGNRQDYQGGK